MVLAAVKMPVLLLRQMDFLNPCHRYNRCPMGKRELIVVPTRWTCGHVGLWVTLMAKPS